METSVFSIPCVVVAPPPSLPLLFLVRKCQPLWVSEKMNGKLANSCKHPQTFSWSLVTFQWTVLCNSKKPGLLNTATIVPVSEMCACLTRHMPTPPGAGQAHNYFSLTEKLWLFKKRKKNTQALTCWAIAFKRQSCNHSKAQTAPGLCC